MAYAFVGEAALDYLPCHYGASQLMFRGPRRSLERPFIAFIGGIETYGKFIENPFPDLVEDTFGYGSVNLGVVNAGLDVYLNTPDLLDLAQEAEAVVVQVVGAQNLSNKFYSVHPRRNDRFLGATPALKSLYRDVDFTRFNFTRHLLQGLMAAAPERFAVVADELRRAWVSRMEELMSLLPAERTLLFWAGSAKPPAEGAPVNLSADPLLVDEAMLAGVKGRAASYVEAVIDRAGTSEGLSGMVFAPLDAPAAAGLPGPLAHRRMARAVSTGLRRLLH